VSSDGERRLTRIGAGLIAAIWLCRCCGCCGGSRSRQDRERFGRRDSPEDIKARRGAQGLFYAAFGSLMGSRKELERRSSSWC
jgi:hypothetical protein